MNIKNSEKTEPSNPMGSLERLRKIEGQVRGLQHMLENHRYCVDVLYQVIAVKRALDGVMIEILRGHIDTCVNKAVKRGEGLEKLEELMRMFQRIVK